MFSPAGWSSLVATFNFSDDDRRFCRVTLMLSFSVRLVLIFSMLVSELRERAVGRGETGEVFSERFELSESEIEFRVFVSEFVEILGGVLKVFHRVGRFVGNRFDDLQHFRRGLAEIGMCVRLRMSRHFLRGPTLVCPE